MSSFTLHSDELTYGCSRDGSQKSRCVHITDSLSHTLVAMLRVSSELFITLAARQGASKNAARNFTKLTNLTLKTLYTKFAMMLKLHSFIYHSKAPIFIK